MHVRIKEPMVNYREDELPRGKGFGDLLECYRYELSFDDSSGTRKVRERYFLVESGNYHKDIYVTTPEDYGELVYHHPDLPEDYSQGYYMWVTDSECELAEMNNKFFADGLEKHQQWEMPERI